MGTDFTDHYRKCSRCSMSRSSHISTDGICIDHQRRCNHKEHFNWPHDKEAGCEKCAAIKKAKDAKEKQEKQEKIQREADKKARNAAGNKKDRGGKKGGDGDAGGAVAAH